jgi:hypothetical protein
MEVGIVKPIPAFLTHHQTFVDQRQCSLIVLRGSFKPRKSAKIAGNSDCLDPDNPLAICGSHLHRVAYCPAECDPSSDTSVSVQDDTPRHAVG